jgi:type IV secretory pathway VirB4 component
MSQIPAWQSTLPIGVDKMAATHFVSSQIVGSFWPFFTATCGSPDGVPFGFAVASREPVLLNPFSNAEKNDGGNIFISGQANSGKTFAAATLIWRFLPLGMRFVVSEKSSPKESPYRFLAELLGQELAEYIILGPSSNCILNPFDLGPDDGKASEISGPKLNFLLSLFELMTATEQVPSLSQDERATLARLIRLSYEEEGKRSSIPTISDIVRLMASALAKESEPQKKEREQDILNCLRLFTRAGEYGRFLDGNTTMQGDKLLRVFNANEVGDSRLQQINSLILADFMQRKSAEAFERKQKSASVFDEVGDLMKSEVGAGMLSDMAARAKQYKAPLIAITKDLPKFFSHAEEADEFIKTAHSKILMRHDSEAAILLQKKLQLTLAEKACIEAFEDSPEEKRRDSKALLIAGANRGSIRLVPSPMDYWAFTSEPTKDIPRRTQMIEEVKTKNPTINNTDACRQAVYYLGIEQN